jgi:AcrR family transcriptional regulator
MIQSAALLMRERGVEATSFSDVLERSGAPRGSIYHHFPHGKNQLVEEATRYAGEFLASGLATALAEHDPIRAVTAFVDSWRTQLGASDFGAGCPVVAAALEGERSPGARDAAGAAFTRWQGLIAAALEDTGVAPGRARSLAAMTVASIEGAVILARAQRSNEPLDRVADELGTLIGGALAGPDEPAARSGSAAQGAPARVRQRAPRSAPSAAAPSNDIPEASPNVKPAANESPQP